MMDYDETDIGNAESKSASLKFAEEIAQAVY